jgi:hypothetical protein
VVDHWGPVCLKQSLDHSLEILPFIRLCHPMRVCDTAAFSQYYVVCSKGKYNTKFDLPSLNGMGVGINLNTDYAYQNIGWREWKWEYIHNALPRYANPGWANS